jgi:hypothetical protein
MIQQLFILADSFCKKVNITHRYRKNFGEELARGCENMPDLVLAGMSLRTHKKRSEK